MKKETIAAICTPLGEGGISVIRISGPEALDIANKIFTGNVHSYLSHTAHLGKILSKSGLVIDEALLLVMHEGRSYTGEATVEIMGHGGLLVTQKVLARVLEAGAVAAGPGEFTFRAFQNGKIDLTQAEAIQELIGAKNERALIAAEKQLSGALSIKIKDLQKSLTDIAAIIEAWVDYPEEGLEFATEEEILEMMERIRNKIDNLAKTFHDGKRIAQGINLCLLGSPNVGKSSLMNALLGYNRAIVTPIAGTTRDLLSEDLRIQGFHFSLIDTAGLRATEEIVEIEGIRRSKKAAEEADILLILLDATRVPSDEELELLQTYPEALIVWNKIDLPHTLPFPGVLISAKNHDGIDALKEAIVEKVWKGSLPDQEEILITKERHFLALQNASSFIETIICALRSKTSPEFIVSDIRGALKELSLIIGTNITEDILGAIFSKFCVGK